MDHKLPITEAAEDAPPSYDHVVGNTTTPHATTATTSSAASAEQEKAALARRYAPQEQQTPSAGPSTRASLSFAVVLDKPTRRGRTLTITPSTESLGISHWALNFTNESQARIGRHHPFAHQGSGVRDIAEIIFPKMKWPGDGPVISFFPHEADIERLGARHVSATDRMMTISGFLSLQYSLDFPITRLGTVTWKAAAAATSAAHGDRVASEISPLMPKGGSEKTAAAAAASSSSSSTTLPREEEPWTPFSTLHLVEGDSVDVLAYYNRASPWGSQTGTLIIPQTPRTNQPEIVEAIIVTCATMVVMQDRLGLMTAFIASAYDNVANR